LSIQGLDQKMYAHVFPSRGAYIFGQDLILTIARVHSVKSPPAYLI